MTGRAEFTMHLAKEDFKFSAAHFTLFADGSAELLHGHNYQVELELVGPALDELGLLCDIARIKREIRAICAGLDSRTLIPRRSPELGLLEVGDGVEVVYRDRRYVLPAKDVFFLDLTNTTIELLACFLWRELAPRLEGEGLSALGVGVAETSGQSCWYRSPLG